MNNYLHINCIKQKNCNITKLRTKTKINKTFFLLEYLVFTINYELLVDII